jgi:phage repressor protein C with HTH and peptisase S24 domain
MVNSFLSSHARIIGMPILAVNRHTDSFYRHAWAMRSIGERLRHVRKLRGLNQDQLATMAGIKQPSVSELETGETKEPMASTLISLSAALRVRYEWLAHGQGDMEEPPPSVGYTARDAALPFEPNPLIVEIPMFDVAASMGLGLSMPEQDTVVDHLRLTRTWLQRNLPGVSSPSNLAVISAYGDSMQPTFNDGDILLVDRAVRNVRLDAVYVLAFHDELYIKRIQRRPDGSLAIISDNKVYDPIIVPSDEKESVTVLGRVMWAWNGKRL